MAFPESPSKAFRRRVKALNRKRREEGLSDLPVIRFHDLRHTHATLALSAGINPKVVSERLGRASVTITLDTYSHAIPALQEDAASRMASLIDGIGL